MSGTRPATKPGTRHVFLNPTATRGPANFDRVNSKKNMEDSFLDSILENSSSSLPTVIINLPELEPQSQDLLCPSSLPPLERPYLYSDSAKTPGASNNKSSYTRTTTDKFGWYYYPYDPKASDVWVVFQVSDHPEKVGFAKCGCCGKEMTKDKQASSTSSLGRHYQANSCKSEGIILNLLKCLLIIISYRYHWKTVL